MSTAAPVPTPAEIDKARKLIDTFFPSSSAFWTFDDIKKAFAVNLAAHRLEATEHLLGANADLEMRLKRAIADRDADSHLSLCHFANIASAYEEERAKREALELEARQWKETAQNLRLKLTPVAQL